MSNTRLKRIDVQHNWLNVRNLKGKHLSALAAQRYLVEVDESLQQINRFWTCRTPQWTSWWHFRHMCPCYHHSTDNMKIYYIIRMYQLRIRLKTFGITSQMKWQINESKIFTIAWLTSSTNVSDGNRINSLAVCLSVLHTRELNSLFNCKQTNVYQCITDMSHNNRWLWNSYWQKSYGTTR